MIFYIFPDHFCIQTYGIYTVSSGPEMITPIGFFF